VIQDIVDLVSRQHFQIACQRYFEATHHSEVDGGIQHPNQYFQESQKIINGGDVKENKTSTNNKANKVPTTRVVVPAIKSENIDACSQQTESSTQASEGTLDSDDDHHFENMDI